jgi:carbamoyltransferase
MSIILGLNISGFHSSACLIVDGEIKSAITEERITRIKQDKSFPKNAIKYCCEDAKIKQSEITDIYVGWNPTHYMYKSDNTLNESLKERGKLSYLVLNELASLSCESKLEIKQQLKSLNQCWDIHFIDHHKAHLCNPFLSSGFSTSDFFVADGFGENTTGCVGTVDVKNLSINTFNSFPSPHSLGSFYSTFTQFLGFRPNGDEWKVMALASLGNPDIYYEKVKKLIKVSDTSVELDLSYFEHYLFFTKNYYSDKFIKFFGNPVKTLKGLKQQHYDLVAAVQKVVENVAIEIMTNLHHKTKSKNIVVSGGFFMNSVLNGKILDKTPYENVYIGGSPDDSGISIGSALYGLVFDKKQKLKSSEQLKHNYFGKEYSDKDIEKELVKRKIKYKIVENIEEFVAQKIRDKNIVAWFQGRSEFGQRALGNRSILADPTKEDIKDIVNSSIKYREGFRPFAPSVLEERQDDYFIIPKKQNSYFMEKVFMFKEEHKKNLPGVVHFDGSGRLQTVSKKINPKYHKLIKEFQKISGYGIVLNTSLNVNGMPLVDTPSDAINCFYQSGIDCLVMNNIVVEK